MTNFVKSLTTLENMPLMLIYIQCKLLNFWSIGSNPVALVLRQFVNMTKHTNVFSEH